MTSTQKKNLGEGNGTQGTPLHVRNVGRVYFSAARMSTRAVAEFTRIPVQTTPEGYMVAERADLFTWLPAQAGRGAALVTMLPDAAELGLELEAYEAWLGRAVDACFAASAGPTVFAQTDRLVGGTWFSKAGFIMARAPVPLLWHKLALRREPGATDLHRPTFTHLLAFGPGRPGVRRPDVIRGGAKRWRNGVGDAAAAFIAHWMHSVGVRICLNPCSGSGTFADALEAHDIQVLACDADPDRWLGEMPEAAHV